MKMTIEQLKFMRERFSWGGIQNESEAIAALDELIVLREALKVDQVPVAEIKFHPSTDKHPCMYWFGKQDRDFPVGTQFFTAPQKPVALPGKKALNPNDPSPIWCASKEWNSAIDACRAAIEAAGGIVKDGE